MRHCAFALALAICSATVATADEAKPPATPTVSLAISSDEATGIISAYNVASDACGTSTLRACLSVRNTGDPVIAKIMQAAKAAQEKPAAPAPAKK